jgi:hypothetical protein
MKHEIELDEKQELALQAFSVLSRKDPEKLICSWLKQAIENLYTSGWDSAIELVEPEQEEVG